MAAAPNPAARRRWHCMASGWRLPALLVMAECTLFWPPQAHAQAQARPPVTFASSLPAPQFTLPQPFTSLMRDPKNRGFATPQAGTGSVSWRIEGKTATFDQGSVERVLLNWQSFDIAEGYTVRFLQDKDPSKLVSALNRVWSERPSLILGSLQADREVIIQNSQGVHFGGSARVNAGRFVASTLGVSDAVFNRGLRNVLDASPVFATTAADSRTTNLDSAVTLEAGAEIVSAAGGDVLLVAPRVVNRGRIETPSGQAVLAAGDKVYLMSSSDPAQRGLIVAVDPIRVGGAGVTTGAVDPTLGLAENAAQGTSKSINGVAVPASTPDSTAGLVQRLNEIRAESGTVNLVGLTVRQNGQVNATTAVKGANGAVFLQAMASTVALEAAGPTGASSRGLQIEPGSSVRVAAELGSVELAAGSVTAVLPSKSAATQLDAEAFNPSLVRVDGSSIRVGAGATVLAPAGRIDLRAGRSADGGDLLFDSQGAVQAADGSRISIEAGAKLSTAGLQGVAVDGARFQGEQRLFRIELADAPVQRSGPLYRSNLFFDLRDAGRIQIADVTGSLAALGRTASERSTAGGTLSVQTNGVLTVAPGAQLDVSGGSVNVSTATIKNSLLQQDGRLATFRAAAAGNTVDALSANVQLTDVPAFTEGAAGGTLALTGRQMQLAGQLLGQVQQGERQRDGRSTAAAPATLTIGRGGRDIDYDIRTLQLRPELPPTSAPLADPPPGLALSLPQVQAGGFGSLVLRAEQVTQPAGGSLNLGPLGNLDIEARTISLNGSFRAPGGRLSVQTPAAAGDADTTGDGDIRLGAQTRLDVAGLWTNDLPGAPGAAEAAPVQTAGGSVAVRSAHSLFVQPGAAIDASGGAWLSSAGRLTRGAAGSVALTTSTNYLLSPELQIAGLSLRAFDFSRGGRLTLGAPSLTLAAGATTGPLIGPGLFTDAGFGSLTLVSLRDILVTSGTRLAPSLLNWQLTADHRSQASGAMSAKVATALPLDTRLAERQPVSLSLSASRPLLSVGGSVLVERGADILLEPGASLSVSATRNVAVGATGGVDGQTSRLSAPGGAIQLSIAGNRGSPGGNDPDGFLPDQAIWLGAGARLAVDGVAVLRRDTATAAQAQFSDGGGPATPPEQRQVGKVLGGGSIALNAARGYVVADAGARLSLDGSAAVLNVPGLANAVRVAGSAGSLAVSSAEGIVLDAQVSAQAPRGPAGQALADGGQLSVALGAGGVYTLTESALHPYPTDPRLVSVGAHAGLLQRSGARFGSDLAASLGNGTAFVDAGLLQRAGFGGLNLAAGDLIRFDSSLNLAMPLGVTLNAPALAAAPGRQVAFSAQTAQLGDASLFRRGSAADTSAGADTSPLADTALRITAPAIEVVGNLGLQGFSTVTLDAAAPPPGAAGGGEIRWSATNPNFGRLESLNRSLQFAGRLELRAAQTYATSASQYSLVGLAGSQVVLRPGAAPAAAAPLSAFGSLSITASQIDQGGVMRQPFGRISLTADTLRLGEGSVTSVAGTGASVLFGKTLNLAEWQLPGGDANFDPAREKSIVLNAGQVTTAASARVQAGGGGQVLASEFFPGIGGSRDFTAAADTYAVLPSHAAVAAQAPDGGSLGAAASGRQFVVTMPGSGLAPGRYTLMPVRQALLAGALPQGAFLVRRAADQGSSVLRAPIAQDDGSVVVTGYITQAGSVASGTPGERFVIEPPATFNARSDQRISNVSTLLADRAATLGTATPPLPRDGGSIQINSTGGTRSLWSAQVDLAAGDGGRAGRLDVAATSVALVDNLAKTPAGALGISAAVIENSGAGSTLLGGRRSRDTAPGADGTPAWQLDTAGTTRVSLDLGTRPLVVEELLLGSSDSVVLAAGSQVAATRSPTQGARTLNLLGAGSLAAVSANPLQVVRDAGTPAAAARLEVGAGSTLAGSQVALDSTGVLQLAPDARLQAPSLALGAQRTVVGELAVADPQATVLGGSLLQSLRQASDLLLRGYASLGFAGTQDWAQRNPATGQPGNVQRQVVLDSPLLRGLPGTDGQPARVDIAAQEFVLRNTTGQTAPPAASPAQGSGVLQLQALPPLRYASTGGLTIGPGPLQLAFDTATLRSTGDIVLDGRGDSALAAQGDLTLSAARLTAGTGVQQSLASGGTLRVAQEAGSRTLGERAGQGAAVQLSATTLRQDGVIDLPGGHLVLQAAGSAPDAVAVDFGAGSLTSVAGFRLDNGFTAYGTAGSVTASAAQGRIAVRGTVDVSAARRADGSPGEGDAGRLSLSASGTGGALQLAPGQAALLGRAGGLAEDRGGSLQVDVRSMPSADTLAAAARAGGLTGEFALRVREGDVALDTDVRAQRVQVAADGGNLAIGANGAALRLDASAPAGGQVRLLAGGDLVLGENASIDARSLRAGANGGEVLLGSGQGQLRLKPGATVDARGDDAQDGSIVLRAARTADNSDVGLDRIDTTRLRAGDVSIEAVRVFEDVATLARNSDGDPSTVSQSALRADSNEFMASKAALLNRLGVPAAESASGRVSLRAGVELRSSGDLLVADDWNLAGTSASPNLDRPGGDAGVLTLRAAGSLQLSGSLSDGFSNFTPGAVLNGNARSWSFRLAAGADMGAANPLAVLSLQALQDGQGDLVIDSGRVLRTGAGAIGLAAARDVVFADDGSGNGPGLAYVAGRRLPTERAPAASLFAGQAARPVLSEQGRSLDVQAGRDIVAPEATQLISNWFWRSGTASTRADEAGLYSLNSQLAWWAEPGRFQQVLASFGGGSLWARAERDVVNLQAMVPSAGWVDSRSLAAASSGGLRVINGGDLLVAAGRDLLGGQFFVGRGEGRLLAGRTMGDAPGNVQALAPILALQDGQWRLSARDGLTVTNAFNPTAVPTSAEDNRPGRSGTFYTWGAGSGVRLWANAGNLVVRAGINENQAKALGLDINESSDASAFSVQPASLRAAAAGGDINLLSGEGLPLSVLFPSASGQLSLWSGGSILLLSTLGASQLVMAGNDPASWPQPGSPLGRESVGNLVGSNSGLLAGLLSDSLPLTSLHAGDTEPARLHAQGNLEIRGSSKLVTTLAVPKPASLTAGGDILELSLRAQNLSAKDVTTAAAGRNYLSGITGRVELAGPGRLEIEAGTNIDLGSSAGVETSGNLRNPALPAQGASVRLAAAGAGRIDLTVLQTDFLGAAPGAAPQPGGSPRQQRAQAMLLAFVRDALKSPQLDLASAWRQFQTFPAAAQAVLGQQVLAAEFNAVYLAGSTPTASEFEAALQPVFERHRGALVAAAQTALAQGRGLLLPGRELVQGQALADYVTELQALDYTRLELQSVVGARVVSLQAVRNGWRERVASDLGSTVTALDALALSNPRDARVLAYQAGLAEISGARFEAYRNQVLAAELGSAAAAASNFGRRSLPMRLALFDQGFAVAELAGVGSFEASPGWTAAAPLLGFNGRLDMTQSSVLTRRGGDITLLNPGGGIVVGLKDAGSDTGSAPKGVIALGGGNVFGYAKDDFQVNTQRVFIVGAGDLSIWSSRGDIDSGRGANTAVAAPPLAPRRSADGVVFEVPPITTGSGLGILADAQGRRSGTIGLFPALGEILALDAFIRAPSVVLGSTVKGADNLLSGSVGGAAAVVAAPPAAVVAPPPAAQPRGVAGGADAAAAEARQREGLLTVELLGLGQTGADPCDDPKNKDNDECKQRSR